jgi:hypothetical protein
VFIASASDHPEVVGVVVTEVVARRSTTRGLVHRQVEVAGILSPHHDDHDSREPNCFRKVLIGMST